MSQFSDFFNQCNGKPIETEDPSNLDQCFDLALAWVDWIKIPRETIRHLRAFQIWTQPLDSTLQYFDYIPNTPNGIPKEGDIVVFSDAVGVSGHVSIANGEGDGKGFTSFDQNWSGIQVAKLVKHSYASVLGWLRVKQPLTASVDPVIFAQSDAFIAVATTLNVSASKDVVIGEIRKLIGYEDAIVLKDKVIADAQKQIDNLKQNLSETQQNNKVLQENYTAAQDMLQKDEARMKDFEQRIKDLETGMAKPDWSAWELIISGIKKLFGITK